MNSQIFKNNIPNMYFFELLDKICIKTNDYYLFNYESFKKGMYLQYIEEFIRLCLEYYHKSKWKYLERKITYNSFTTIIRQICNNNKIQYTSKMKYDKSKYCITYIIYYQ